MVKLTLDLIARGVSRHSRKKKDENVQQFVRRLTHLYLENKNIDDAGDDLSLCRTLIVLYMYDNQLRQIPCLNGSPSLTHLYLQNNNISKIENLSSLTRLQKLFLGGNTITVIEGLDKLIQLQELHMENQRQPHGEHLLFDPRSLKAISETLQVLNISGNNMTNISELEHLPRLTHLIAANNQLNNMKEMSQLLSSWNCLCCLDLTGNPLCQRAKYKDQIIVIGKNLETLDGKSITSTERQFLLNWQVIRDLHSKRLQNSLMRQDTFSSVSSEVAGGINVLPPVESANRHRTVLSASLMPGVARKQFGEVSDKYNFPDHSQTYKVNRGAVHIKYSSSQDIAHMNGVEYQRDISRPLSVECLHLKHSAHRRRL